MSEQHLEESGVAYPGTNGRPYVVDSANDAAVDPDASDAGGREFSLKSFKTFARQHPLLVGFGAAGIGATVVTLGAGYVLYRGAQRTLPFRAFKLARFLVTF
ncbi:MAG TPA: hypothetical protein VK524_15085 [Polyangiaceae bacterium]|nr:hypothetical protein [Polyangiaceae bacterium]